MANQKLGVILNLDGTKYIQGVKNAQKTTEKSAGKMSKAFNKISFRNVLYGAVGIYALKRAVEGIGGAFVAAASKAENYRVRLKTTLRSQLEANRMFNAMAEYASQVPHEFDAILSSATSLSGVMTGGVEEVKRYMPIIGDLAAVTGMTIQEVTGQVIRMYSAGAATADLFRERGVLAMLGFQAGVRYTAEETRKILIGSWESSTSKIRGATDGLAKNWTGKVSMMKDAWFIFRKSLMESGGFVLPKRIVDGITANIKKMNAWVIANDKLLAQKFDTWGDNTVKVFSKINTETSQIVSNLVAIKEWAVDAPQYGFGAGVDKSQGWTSSLRGKYNKGVNALLGTNYDESGVHYGTPWREKIQIGYNKGFNWLTGSNYRTTPTTPGLDYLKPNGPVLKNMYEAQRGFIGPPVPAEWKPPTPPASTYYRGGLPSGGYGAPALGNKPFDPYAYTKQNTIQVSGASQTNAIKDMGVQWDNVANSMRYSFANTFRSITSEAITFKNIMVSIAHDISDAFATEASQQIADYMIGAFVESAANNGAAKT